MITFRSPTPGAWPKRKPMPSHMVAEPLPYVFANSESLHCLSCCRVPGTESNGSSSPDFPWPASDFLTGLLHLNNQIMENTAMSGILLSSNGKITRAELALIPAPEATPTHQPLAHYRIVEALLE